MLADKRDGDYKLQDISLRSNRETTATTEALLRPPARAAAHHGTPAAPPPRPPPHAPCTALIHSLNPRTEAKYTYEAANPPAARHPSGTRDPDKGLPTKRGTAVALVVYRKRAAR